MSDHFIFERLDKIWKEMQCMHQDLIRVLKWIALKEIDFVQVEGGMNFSVVAGASASFEGIFTPANGAQKAGTVPQWAASDPNIVLSPSADGTSCQVQTSPGTTDTSFVLTMSATSSDPTQGTNGVLSVSHTIAVTQPPPPPPPALTGVDFQQTAG